MAPTIIYFGAAPTTIIMQAAATFDGTTPQGSVPAMSPGMYVFPAQTGGGVYNFHELVGNGDPVTVLSVSFAGGGTLTVKRNIDKVTPAVAITVGTITTAGELTFSPGELTLNQGEQLLFTSTAGSGTQTLAVSAVLSSRVQVA